MKAAELIQPVLKAAELIPPKATDIKRKKIKVRDGLSNHNC